MSEWDSAAATASLDRLAGTAREALALRIPVRPGDLQEIQSIGSRLDSFEAGLRRSLRLAAQEMTRLEGVVATQRDRAKGSERNLARTIGELVEAQEVIANLTEERDRLSEQLYNLDSYLHGSVFRVVVDQLDRLRKRGLWYIEGMMA